MTSSKSPSSIFPFSFVIFALIAAPYGLMWKLSRIRDFDPDEFEHLHAAWCVAQGLVPYRDFFEHHTPWFYYFLAPFIHFLKADADAENVIQFLFLSRTFMWLLTGVIVLLIYHIGRSWRDRKTGLVAAMFFMNTLMVLEKCLEARPDILSTIAWLGCLSFALHAVQAAANGNQRAATQRLIWSGIFWGAALMFSQKLLMAGPGLIMTALWYVLDERIEGTIRRKLGNIALFVAGTAMPVFLTMAYFAWCGAFTSFIKFNFIMNFGWLFHIPPTGLIRRLLGQNPVFVAMGLAGCVFSASQMFRRDKIGRGDFILVINFTSLIAGLFLLPVAQRQYFLTFLPLGALFAAMILMNIAAGINKMAPIYRQHGLFVVIITGAAVWAAIRWFNIPIWEERFFFYAGIAMACAALFLVLKFPDLAVAVFLAALSIHSLKQVSNAFLWRNDDTLRKVRYLHQNTAPSETIMEGWKGFGVFRPHAYFYYFTHFEIHPIITENQRSELLHDLENGRIRPKFIVLDEQLKGLSPRLSRFFLDHYSETDERLIWSRKPAKSSNR